MHAGNNTMNMTDKERGQNIQFLILPSTKDYFRNVTKFNAQVFVKCLITNYFIHLRRIIVIQ